MFTHKLLLNGLVGLTGTIFAGSSAVPAKTLTRPAAPVAAEAAAPSAAPSAPATQRTKVSSVVAKASDALAALGSAVRPLSHPKALESAFKGYFAYLSKHPDEVKKPYLYFVDYGLPSTEPRGYVFDMKTLRVVDGPFTVAHGRGSSTSQYGVPTRFSNTSGAATTSLGLYLAQSTYGFSGKSAGRAYKSIGLRLRGLSGSFNDKALARGVVAHGAPYVTASKAGRSEGCPAMEQTRAQRLLPRIADGGMVFLFAPDADWMARDPWLGGSAS
jgi:hypothetical protein